MRSARSSVTVVTGVGASITDHSSGWVGADKPGGAKQIAAFRELKLNYETQFKQNKFGDGFITVRRFKRPTELPRREDRSLSPPRHLALAAPCAAAAARRLVRERSAAARSRA